jgi:hypothetical protein
MSQLGVSPDRFFDAPYEARKIVAARTLRFVRGSEFAPFTANYSRDGVVVNNILAGFGGLGQVTGGVGEWFEFAFERNIIYYDLGRLVESWSPQTRRFERNLYWNASGKSVRVGNRSFAEWQAAGQDGNSVVADPLFVDPEHGDFRLRPGSPAAQIGFEPWDLSDVGPRPVRAATAVTEEPTTPLSPSFTLDPNYPNPFNSETVIRFALPADGAVELAVYNLAGQQVATLVEGARPAGTYVVRWDGTDDRGKALASGVYLYRLWAGEQEQTHKLLLLK